MSNETIEATHDPKITILDCTPNVQEIDDSSLIDRQDSDEKEEIVEPSQQQLEEVIKKKYGGLLPKKPPLISKDHEHAFFDSADWALGKQGAQKSKGPLEALRPKLQPTPHDQVRSRRSTYAHTNDGKDTNNHDDIAHKDDEGTIEDDPTKSNDEPCENQNCQN